MFINVGPQERNVRIAAGVVFMAAGFAAPIPDLWHAIIMSLGVAMLFTAALAFCPFKALLLRRVS